MAAKVHTASQSAKNRIGDAKDCTKPVQNGSNGAQAEIQRRDLTIHYLHAIGKTNAEIAKTLNVHRNLVSRVVTAAPPSVSELTETLKRLDDKAVFRLEAAIDSDNPLIWWDAIKFYLTRRSILGEPEERGTTVNVTIIEAEREKKLATGLARFGVVVPTPGDN